MKFVTAKKDEEPSSEHNNDSPNDTNSKRSLFVLLREECHFKSIFFWRILYLMFLSCAVAIIGFRAYTRSYNNETRSVAQIFSTSAQYILKQMEVYLENQQMSSEALAAMYGYTFPTVSQWPNVHLDGFEEISSKLHSTPTVFLPIVTPNQLSSFENYYGDYYTRQYPNSSSDVGVKDFGFGVSGYNTTLSSFPDGFYHDTSAETHYGSPNIILTPVAQISEVTNGATVLLRNVHQEEQAGRLLDSILQCAENRAADGNLDVKCGQLSEFALVPKFSSSPASVVMEPIYPMSNETVVSGFIMTIMDWADVISATITSDTDDMDCVLQSKHTYQTYHIRGGVAFWVGQNGDFHNKDLDSYREQIVLQLWYEGGSSTDGSVRVQSTALDDVEGEGNVQGGGTLVMHLYPTKNYFESRRTDFPTSAAWILSVVMISSFILFFLYDHFVHREFGAKSAVLESKKRFVRFISHEVRTPLNTVWLGLKILEEDLLKYLDEEADDTDVAMIATATTTSGDGDGDGDVATVASAATRNSIASISGVVIPQSLSPSSSTSSLRPTHYPTAGGGDGTGGSLVPTTRNRKSRSKMRDTVRDWQELTAEVIGNTKNAVDVLNDLINYDKIEMGILSLELSVVPIWQLIDAAVHEFRLQAVSSRVHVEVDFSQLTHQSRAREGSYEITSPRNSYIRPFAPEDLPVTTPGSSVNLAVNIPPIATAAHVISGVDDHRQQGNNRADEGRLDYLRDCGKGLFRDGVIKAKVIGDNMRLTQVVRNLTSNAIKFTPQDGHIKIKGEWLDRDDHFKGKSSPRSSSLNKTTAQGATTTATSSSSTTTSGVRDGGDVTTVSAASNHQNSVLPSESVVQYFPLVDGTTAVCKKAGMLKLEVQDSGAGMTKEQVDSLFGEGVQFNVNKLQAGGGSGLGLFIAKGFVEAHQGTLTVSSEGLGKGTTFTLMLPLHNVLQIDDHEECFDPENKHSGRTGSTRPVSATTAGSQQQQRESRQSSSRSSASHQISGTASQMSRLNSVQSRRPMHILVVEDSAPSMKMVVRLLKSKGHTCDEAINGQEAVDKVRANYTRGNKSASNAKSDTNSYSEDSYSNSGSKSRDTRSDDYEIEASATGGPAAKAGAGAGAVDVTATSSPPPPPPHRHYDCILMDYEMPIVNGPAAAKMIRQLGCTCFIVGITGNVLPQDVKYFKDYGANVVLAKPLNYEALELAWDKNNIQSKTRVPRSLRRLASIKNNAVDVLQDFDMECDEDGSPVVSVRHNPGSTRIAASAHERELDSRLKGSSSYNSSYSLLQVEEEDQQQHLQPHHGARNAQQDNSSVENSRTKTPCEMV